MTIKLSTTKGRKTWYSVMAGQKTTRSKPRTIGSYGGRQEAMMVAKNWKVEHPGRVVGVYQVSKVKLFATPKQRRHRRIV